MPDERIEIEVAMSIARDADSGKYLIIEKAEDYQSEGEGQEGRYDRTPWEVPGGKIEQADFSVCNRPMARFDRDEYHTAAEGEVVAHAAKRELKEETGLNAETVEVLPPYRTQQEDRGTFKDIYFYPCLLEAERDDAVTEEKLREADAEHTGYKWVEPEQLDTYLTEHEMEAFEALGVV